MTRYVSSALLAIIASLLGVITYNTGLGKIFPQSQAPGISCDSLLTQRLFYSQIFGANQETKAVAEPILNASSVPAIQKMVSGNSNIDGAKSSFMYSLSNLGKCEAHLVLQRVDADGNNVMYVPYTIATYVATESDRDENRSIVEVMKINFPGIDKQKE